MKPLLKVLAILYLILSIPMFMAPWAIFARAIDQKFSADSVLLIILSLVILIIPLIGVFCSIRYLRRKDIESACDISVLTGILVWMISSGLFPRTWLRDHQWMDLVALVVCIGLGVIAHKIFQKKIQEHFRNSASVDFIKAL